MLRRQVDPRQRTSPAARVASASGHKRPPALQKKVAGSWSADFGKLIADETEKWGKVIRAAGIKAE